MDLIDWRRVDELRAETGDAEFGDVAEIFLSEVETTLAELAAGDGGPSPVNALHYIKGSALNLGFASVATLCAALEQAARQGPLPQGALDELEQTWTKSRADFAEADPAARQTAKRA